MRVNGIRCDSCGKECLFEADFMAVKPVIDVVPADWLVVGLGQFRDEPWTFCSKRCLRQHPLDPFTPRKAAYYNNAQEEK